MSDMMNAGGMPPDAGADPSGLRSKMSLLNPTDMAAKTALGDVSRGMTVGDFLQKNFGVSPEDPVEKLIQATKDQVKNSTMAGKLGAQPQGATPPPMGAPTPSPAPQAPPPSGGLDALVNKL